MTKQEVEEIEVMIKLMVRKDLSRVLQRIVDKKDLFCEVDREILLEQVKSIAKDYDLTYIESED